MGKVLAVTSNGLKQLQILSAMICKNVCVKFRLVIVIYSKPPDWVKPSITPGLM